MDKEYKDDFKCKALRIDNNWIYGWIIKVEDNGGYHLAMVEEKTQQIYSIQENTICRFTGKKDNAGNDLYQKDVIISLLDGKSVFEICYGDHSEWCPLDQGFMNNVGFYARFIDNKKVFKLEQQCPLGPTEDYAKLIGNIVNNPELVKRKGKFN